MRFILIPLLIAGLGCYGQSDLVRPPPEPVVPEPVVPPPPPPPPPPPIPTTLTITPDTLIYSIFASYRSFWRDSLAYWGVQTSRHGPFVYSANNRTRPVIRRTMTDQYGDTIPYSEYRRWVGLTPF